MTGSQLHHFDVLLRGRALVAECIQSLGVRLGPGSRFELYSKLIGALEAGALPHRELLEAQHLVPEMDQLITICGVLRKEPWFAAALEKVLATGPVGDLQFELYLNAVLREVGYEVRRNEPDLVASLGSTRIAVAAKRPRSLRAIGDMVRDGARQLRSAGIPGLVALDLSQVCIEGVLVTLGCETENDRNPAAGALMNSFVSRHHGALVAALRGERYQPHLLGYVLSVSLPMQTHTPHQFAAGRAVGVWVRPDAPNLALLEPLTERLA